MNKKAFITSIVTGLGVGLAMMPIFNQEVKNLDEYNIDVHDNDTSFAISTINTLIVSTVTSALFMYKYLTSKQGDIDIEITKKTNLLLNAGKAASVLSALIPVGLLWDVELKDREIEETEGFDQFIAWATFTTAPLLMYKTLNTYHEIEHFLLHKNTFSINNELELSVGGKISLYGIIALSAIARGVSFTYLLNELQKRTDIEENIGLPLSIIAGGILANIIKGVSEYSDLRKLFKTQPSKLNWKKITLGFVSAVEGGWFALPLVTKGLQATKDWNELVKGALFVPFFLSHMNSEAGEIYKSFLSVTEKVTHEESKIQELLGELEEENV